MRTLAMVFDHCNADYFNWKLYVWLRVNCQCSVRCKIDVFMMKRHVLDKEIQLYDYSFLYDSKNSYNFRKVHKYRKMRKPICKKSFNCCCSFINCVYFWPRHTRYPSNNLHCLIFFLNMHLSFLTYSLRMIHLIYLLFFSGFRFLDLL